MHGAYAVLRNNTVYRYRRVPSSFVHAGSFAPRLGVRCAPLAGNMLPLYGQATIAYSTNSDMACPEKKKENLSGRRERRWRDGLCGATRILTATQQLRLVATFYLLCNRAYTHTLPAPATMHGHTHYRTFSGCCPSGHFGLPLFTLCLFGLDSLLPTRLPALLRVLHTHAASLDYYLCSLRTAVQFMCQHTYHTHTLLDTPRRRWVCYRRAFARCTCNGLPHSAVHCYRNAPRHATTLRYTPGYTAYRSGCTPAALRVLLRFADCALAYTRG